jgi:ferredoxin
MADPNEKYEDNDPGESVINGQRVSFYVDKNCIICAACIYEAPNNFKESDDATHDVVFKQPENEEELIQCYSALEVCPVEAIGDDG